MRCVPNARNMDDKGLNNMQNFPLLVTQNTPSRNKAMAANEQKGVEPVTPFKQVLSQQVKNGPSKEKVRGQDKTQHKPSPVQSQSKSQPQAKPDQTQASTGVDDKDTGSIGGVDKKDLLTRWQHKSVKLAKPQEDASLVAAETEPADQLASIAAMQVQQAGVMPAQHNVLLPDAQAVETPHLTEKTPEALQAMVPDAVSGSYTPKPALSESAPRLHDKQVLETDQQLKVADIPQAADLSRPFSARLSESQERLTSELPNMLEQVAVGKRMQEVATPPAMLMAQPPKAVEIGSMPGSSNLIEVYPGKPGWDTAISQKVVWMVGAAEQSATLTLNPPELGPLQVVISVNNEKADTTFISENPDVRKALEDGIPALRDLMSEAGLQLGQANVSTGRQQGAFQQAHKERNLMHPASDVVLQEDGKRQESRVVTRVQNGLVDTFA